MTREELMKLPVGTLLYNGKTEGVIVEEYGMKFISIHIPICAMSNRREDCNARPEGWEAVDFEYLNQNYGKAVSSK